MTRITDWISILAAVVLMTGAASAQDETKKELDDLKKKVQKLEDRLSQDEDKSLMEGQEPMKTKGGATFTLYGFARLDIAYDDSEMSDPQIPQYVSPEVSGGNNDDEDITIYTKLSRLGLDFDGGDIEIVDGKITGRIEVDFYGDASDSRNQFRMRHAYLKLEWDEFFILAGQTSDLISPLYPSANADMINWNAGNLGDRRPQLRFDYHPKAGPGTIYVQLALTQGGAVSSTNADGDGTTDQEDSGIPLIQFRVAYKFGAPWVEKKDVEVGIWYLYGEEEFDNATQDDFDVNGYGLDFSVPIYQDRIWIKGEFWAGENLDDVRGGMGQGVNLGLNDEIEARGYWIEAGARYTDWGTAYLGFSRDNPVNEDVGSGAGARHRNTVTYVGSSVSILDPVHFGLEILLWETEYSGDTDGDNTRVKLWIMWKF